MKLEVLRCPCCGFNLEKPVKKCPMCRTYFQVKENEEKPDKSIGEYFLEGLSEWEEEE